MEVKSILAEHRAIAELRSSPPGIIINKLLIVAQRQSATLRSRAVALLSPRPMRRSRPVVPYVSTGRDRYSGCTVLRTVALATPNRAWPRRCSSHPRMAPGHRTVTEGRSQNIKLTFSRPVAAQC
jgi:hypothetical protein